MNFAMLTIATVAMFLTVCVTQTSAIQYRAVDLLTLPGTSGLHNGKISARGRNLVIAGVSERGLSTHLYQPDATGHWSLFASTKPTPRKVSANPAQSVATDGQYTVVGSLYDDQAGFVSGSSYVFEIDGRNLKQSSVITGDDTDTGDLFGFAVDIQGSQMVVGAPGVGGIVYPTGSVARGIGAAYVFTRSAVGQWTQMARLSRQEASPGMEFGTAVAISGSTVMVGSKTDDGLLSKIGSVYIFRDDGSGTWSQVSKIRASDPAIDAYFGHSISISGSQMIVGAPGAANDHWGNSGGAAYVFEVDGSGNWNQVAKLAPDGPLVEGFGFSVSMEGSLAVIGAYRNDSRIGNSSNAAYIFRRDESGLWKQLDKLVSSDLAGTEGFGTGVTTDGTSVFVAARKFTSPNIAYGRVYVFAIPESNTLALAMAGGLGILIRALADGANEIGLDRDLTLNRANVRSFPAASRMPALDFPAPRWRKTIGTSAKVASTTVRSQSISSRYANPEASTDFKSTSRSLATRYARKAPLASRTGKRRS